ncbi:hypothetical protein PFMC_02848 [Plasmodium falciparum CAMP/Malaysia]|uniref:Uncharacterized protein n=1 Tax=Plasmodium falciparum (isolate Camp / Malaysia) TaxID=5835 RepID=A0A024X8E3_PLAFC|nr:hypothetical protein PFMC_02848 [Plasmodium falciparum CAMP/Malaysia]
MLSIHHKVYDKLNYINKLTFCHGYNIIYKKNYSSGAEYSSNISRIFYHLNEKLKNVREELRKNEDNYKKEKDKNNNIKVDIINKSESYIKKENVNDVKDNNEISYNTKDPLEMDIMYECSSKEKKLIYIYKQYDKIICKINYDKMMGRDLSYCMNILSKIKYFKDNIFWYKASNKLIKGYMLHRINIQSYYIIANALSNIHLLYDTKNKNIQYKNHKQIFNKHIINESICNNKIVNNNLQYHKVPYQNIKNESSSPFRYISFEDKIILEDDKNNICKYHNIYDQIAYRFIIDIQNMNLDSISCTINLFSKMNLLKYNLLGYYFADYFVLYLINHNKNNNNNNNNKNNNKNNHYNNNNNNNKNNHYNNNKNNHYNNNKNNHYNNNNNHYNNNNDKNDKKFISQNKSYSTIFSYLMNKNKYVDISPNKCNISKLVIILHSLVKSNVIHIEFFYICLQYFNKYFIHLNNIDICNILYSFSRCQLAIKSNHTINKLCMRKRIMDNCFQNFVNNIIKKLNIYNEYYSMDQINNMENMYNAYYDYFHKLKNNLLSLSSPTNFFLCINNDGKLDKLKCWNVLNKIINHIEKNEKVLNNFTSLQISSIILSICKLKINSLNIFYALNYRVHYLWKYFSLHSIADYLYVINERNIYDEQISFLLFYQFVKIIMWKYLQYMENKLCIASINNGIHKNKIKQNNQGIIYHLLLNGQNDHNNHNKDNNNNNAILKKKRKKKLHLLNDSDISMCIRIFQSFSKFDIIKNINMFLYYYHIYFPYDISTICIKYDKLLNKKKILMRDTLEMDMVIKRNTCNDEIQIKTTNQQATICCDDNQNYNYNYNIFKSGNHFNLYNNKEGQNMYHNFLSYQQNEQDDHKNFWMNLNLYPKKSFLFLHSYKKYIDIIMLYTLRTFFFLIFQHYHSITLDKKCLLCYFMLSVPHFLYPFKLYNKNNLLGNIYDIKYMNKDTNNNHIDNNIYPFKLYFKKKWKHFNIYIPPSAYILLDILYNMQLDKLNEITIRQIYTCLLCLHLNIIKFCYYIRPYNNKKNKKNNYDNNNNNNNNNNTLSLHKEFIFHLLSLNMLKKMNSFLDHVNQNRTQQNEINLTSRTHNEVYNYLKSLIGSNMFYKKGKKINQKSEYIVGPFVLDCVIEFL